MKIALVNRYHPQDVLGGSEIQCAQLQKAWEGLGCSTIYLALDGQGLAGESSINGCRVVRLSPQLSLRTFSALHTVLRDESVDMVYLRSFNQLYACARVCRQLKILCLYNTCNVNDLKIWRPFLKTKSITSWFQQSRGVVNRYLNWKTLFKIPVVTINHEHEAYLLAKGSRARCIYNSMLDDYPQSPVEKQKIVCWVANIKKRKRPEIFFDLIRDLNQPDWRYVMVGEIQSDKKYYLKLIRDFEKEQPGFEWRGSQTPDEVNHLLAQSRLLVSTAEPEGFGNNLIQAWLAQCPTVSLEFDADQLMQNQKIGFCPGSYRDFLDSVKRLMSDKILCQQMGQRARHWALENHNLEKNAKKYLDYFHELKTSFQASGSR